MRPRGDRRSRSRSPRRGGGRFQGDRERNDRMVFITNLPYETRWMELKNLVREKGGEVNFVEVLEDTNGKPKGCAIVEFKTREGAEECVKNMGRMEFMGRNIISKEIRDPVAFLRKIKEETGIDFLAKSGNAVGGIRPAEPDRPRAGMYDLFGLSPDFLRKLSIEPPLVDRIFIANLSFNVGTAKIFEIFGLAGKIIWMDLHTDKEGRMKGTGVIQFSHPIEAVQAVSMFNGQRLYDRVLSVKMDKFDKLEKPTESGLPRGLEGLGMGLGADGAPLKDVASVVASMNRDRHHPPSNTPMVAAPYGAAPMGGAGFERPPQPGFNRGPAGDFDRQPVGGGLGAGVPYGNTAAAPVFGGNNPSYNAPLYPVKQEAYGDQPVTLLIRNLPVDYTWQIVRDRVAQFGDIDFVDILTPGIARVRYRTAADAERMRAALSGTSVEGRSIAVEFA